MMGAFVLAAAIAAPVPAASPSPQRYLGLIRAAFRAHRPPPPYETYTLVRKQNAANGYPDYAWCYTEHIWVRNRDRAALERKVYRDDYEGPMTFDRPAFNEDRDPGPPTADLFEPAPLHPHPVSFVPTPEASLPPEIGRVALIFESDYTVVSAGLDDGLLHLVVQPKRDPDRNRIREIWADPKSYELRKLRATDKLFTGGKTPYPVDFSMTIGSVDGYPVVTAIHGVVGGGYDDDGKVVDYTFKDIAFPASLPGWYFDARQYGAHQGDDEPS